MDGPSSGVAAVAAVAAVYGYGDSDTGGGDWASATSWSMVAAMEAGANATAVGVHPRGKIQILEPPDGKSRNQGTSTAVRGTGAMG